MQGNDIQSRKGATQEPTEIFHWKTPLRSPPAPTRQTPDWGLTAVWLTLAEAFLGRFGGLIGVDFVLIYCKGMGSQGTKGLIKGGFWHTSEFGSAEFQGQTAKTCGSGYRTSILLAKNVAESEGTMRFIAPGKSKGFADAGRASQRKVSRPLLLPKLASR
jgi:hypothetical protein